MALAIIQLRSTYPCCPSRRVRLPAIQSIPVQVYDRLCPDCKRAWAVTRTLMGERPDVRVDRLEWALVQ